MIDILGQQYTAQLVIAIAMVWQSILMTLALALGVVMWAQWRYNASVEAANLAAKQTELTPQETWQRMRGSVSSQATPGGVSDWHGIIAQEERKKEAHEAAEREEELRRREVVGGVNQEPPEPPGPPRYWARKG